MQAGSGLMLACPAVAAYEVRRSRIRARPNACPSGRRVDKGSALR
jgi:hypothetical protein